MSRWSISPSTTLPSRITSMTRTPLGADHVSDWPRCSGISPPTRVLDRGSLKPPERHVTQARQAIQLGFHKRNSDQAKPVAQRRRFGLAQVAHVNCTEVHHDGR